LYNRSKILALAVLICLPLGLLSLPQSQGITEELSKEPAQFIISGWDYPDEYGQGISLFRFYENSTGAWVEIYGPIGQNPNSSCSFNVNSTGIKIRCSASLNSTFLGLSATIEGTYIIRHSINVTHLGEIIFSQQNFTYFSRGQVGPMYFYQYDVILGFIPQAGNVYITIINCEVWW